MTLNFDHLERSIQTLDQSLQYLHGSEPGSVPYEVFRNAVIKGFELCLETSGNLLRKSLLEFVSDPRKVATLNYKDVLRTAAQYGLLTVDEVERWFTYRDSRNQTAHDYGEQLAEHVLTVIVQFHLDAQTLLRRLKALP
ncbi:nucleotidyltransferase substrate binding protein [uncultured Deefgea sp.]|uniref:nucleotidyltransferase substrate binding protein n=1 Tax=uncultured Deefgea sp. TaxID=1304914 RepID=UPI0026308725|nr:nucleotidyltransferase substrate binding protein [uncultured Deefgea sp.]